MVDRPVVENSTKLDLEFFLFIYKRRPKCKEEFEEFRERLDKRKVKTISHNIINKRNFSLFFTATKGRINPFENTQREYDGW